MTSLWDRLSLGLLLLVALLIATTFRDYGISWDEPFHIEYGERLLRYYSSWGRDTSAFEYINLYLYGGLFDAPVALLSRWLPFGLIDNRHLLIAVSGLLGIIATWRLTHLLAGARAAFFAALLLVTMPSWYGHMFINPKDIPFAATMIWASYFLARLAVQLPRPAWRDVALFGLCAGMAMGMRIGGVLILAYLGAVLGLWFAMALRQQHKRASLPRSALALLPKLAAAGAIAYLVMIIAWPWALSSPLRHPYEALTTFSHFPVTIPALLNGTWIPSDQLPRTYLPLMIAVKTPLLHLLLLLALIPLAAISLSRMKPHHSDQRWLAWAVVLIALLLPLLYVLVSRPALYNEMRHFLFLLPPLAVLTGVAAELLWQRLQQRSHALRTAVAIVVAITLASNVHAMARLHPYEYVSYNGAAGGVGGADGRFELDYWSTSQKALYAGLKQRLLKEGGANTLHQPWRIRLCGAPEAALYYMEDGWRPIWIGEPGEADFEIGIPSRACPPPQLPATLEVRRDGALLGYVNDLRPSP